MRPLGRSLRDESPGRAVVRVAGPIVALGLAQGAYFLSDAWFVGQLGAAQLTALSAAWFAVMALIQLSELTGTGLHSLIARAVGARDPVGGTYTQGLWLGVALWALLAAAFPVCGVYFEWLEIAPGSDIFVHGVDYLGAGLLGAGAMLLNTAVSGVFRGLGQTRPIMFIALATVVLNLLLDPLLIWGAGPLPALGIAGAAWATVIAQGLGALWGMAVLWRRGVRPVTAGPQLRTIGAIARVGGPIALSGVTFAAVSLVLGRFVAQCGDHQLAAIGLGLRVEVVPFVIASGLQTGVATMVGQHLGARATDAALRTVRAGALLAWAILLPLGAFVFLFAEPLAAVLADSEAIAHATARYLQFVAAVVAFRGTEAVFTGALTGLGETRPTMAVVGGSALLRIPLAWVLAFELQLAIDGIWTTIVATTVAKGVLMVAAFYLVWRRLHPGPGSPAHENGAGPLRARARADATGR